MKNAAIKVIILLAASFFVLADKGRKRRLAHRHPASPTLH